MKFITLIAFIISFIILSSTSLARIQHYGVDAYIDDKRVTHVKLSITFEKPQKTFDFTVIGRISNLKAVSPAGPVDCEFKSAGISFVSSNMSLTENKRSVDISFNSDEFIQPLEKIFFFNADFGLAEDVDFVYASFRLPEGIALVTDYSGRISFPENVTTITDGRTIVIVWQLYNIPSTVPLRFQFMYEEIKPPAIFSIRLRWFIILGIAAVAVILTIFYWYKKKPEKVVLSVLDDFERNVIEVINMHNGVVNQKKIVQETNLSKAKISRVVKTLVSRGLIEVERMGRTNKIRLVKKKLKI